MKRFTKLLCVIEPREEHGLALERAVALAKSNRAGLTVVTAVPSVTAGIGMPEGGPISADLQDALVSERTREMEQFLEPYRTQTRIELKILVGTPFLEVIREVLRSEHDLVIKTPERQDWFDRLFGSDDMHLLRKCPCPVWLVKPQAAQRCKRILAAVDIENVVATDANTARLEVSRQILQMASSLAIMDYAELHIVHAWQVLYERVIERGAHRGDSESDVVIYAELVRRHHHDGFNALLKETVGQKSAPHLLKTKKHLVKGRPQREIPALVRKIQADLVVMGTVERAGIPGFFMGNTAETILNQIDCSVLAIKPPGFVTPVTLQE